MSDNNETVDQDSTTDADLRSEIEKLRSKNKELLAEKQRAKQAAQEAKDAADDAAADAAAKNGDIEALKTQHAKALKSLQDKLDTREGDLRTIRVDNAIQAALTAGNVKPEYARAVMAMMKADVDYVDGEASIAGKPIADHMAEFLKSKEGAHFVRAADNSGSGATGSDGSKPGRWSNPPETAEEFNEWMKLSLTDKAMTSLLAKQWNRPDLAS